MTYTIVFSLEANSDLKYLKKSEPQVHKKAMLLVEELREHPRTGSGKPTLKKHNLAVFYARKITDKRRLVYSIKDEIVTVNVVSAKGHYDDK